MRSRRLIHPDSRRRPFVSLLVALALPLAGLAGPGPAPASAAVTPITGPIVITEPGDYRVMADFTVSDPSGDAIVVRASGVRIALGGRTITGPGNKQGRGIVIEGAQVVEIGGGTLRTFGIGVALLDAGNSTVHGVAIEGGDEFADPPAVAPQIGILLVDSARNTIRENRLDRVNLGIFVRGGGSYDNRISQNVATAGSHGLLGICYNPASGAGPAGPQRDQVLRNTLDGFDRGIQASEESTDNRFVANVIRFLTLAYDDRNGGNRFVGNQTTDLTP
jgi:parallel beta-helix repeat protein